MLARSVYTAFATSDTADGVAEVTIAFAISGAAFSFNLTGAAPDGAISAAIGEFGRPCWARWDETREAVSLVSDRPLHLILLPPSPPWRAVDGNPAVMVTPVVSLWPATVASVADADGAFETDGRLAAADVSTMPLEELAGHMGEAWRLCAVPCRRLWRSVLLALRDARQLHRPLKRSLPIFSVSSSGMGHIYLEVTTPDGKLYGAFEEADTASNTAHGHAHNEEDGAHAHEEDGGHSHRRLLRA